MAASGATAAASSSITASSSVRGALAGGDWLNRGHRHRSAHRCRRNAARGSTSSAHCLRHNAARCRRRRGAWHVSVHSWRLWCWLRRRLRLGRLWRSSRCARLLRACLGSSHGGGLEAGGDVSRDVLRCTWLPQLASLEADQGAVPVLGGHRQDAAVRTPRQVGEGGVVDGGHQGQGGRHAGVVHAHMVQRRHRKHHAVRNLKDHGRRVVVGSSSGGG